eukprot:3770916-Pyramimonas_sp.AAC.2
MWLAPGRRAHSFYKSVRASQIEGGWYSTCGSRRSAEHTRSKQLQQFHGLRAGRFQNVTLALAPRAFVVTSCTSSTDWVRVVFKMWLSPGRRARFFYMCRRKTRIEGGSFSTCGSRLSAAHTRVKNLQQLHGLRAVVFNM